MTAVRLGESARYGLRLYAYVLGITILGGAGSVLGAALVWPEVQAWRGTGQVEAATAVAGGLLLFLGLSVLVVGWLSTAYKLLADGVARGRAGSAAPEPEPEPEPEPTPSETPVPGPDPNVATSASQSPSEPETVDAPDPEPTTGSEPVEATDEKPPEPSPEEIAFGSSSNDESTDSEPVDEPEPSPSSSGPLPGQNATSDPLADPGDE